MKDVFISYGRKESKLFATQLHDKLVADGLSVWFDQNDIPLAVDFQHQIDAGIEEAQNFIFIIAPHSIRSAYCRKEIELAVKFGKRIIPILHVEPNGEAIAQYMHPVIQKLNWIPFKQKITEEAPENWPWQDDPGEAYAGLLHLLQSHEEYVKKHTEILQLARAWERHQRDPRYLLVEEERHEAEEWLKTEFTRTQPPCTPALLQAEFICEAKKNARNLHTDAFISYDEEDYEMRRKVYYALARQGITTWQHQKDVKSGQALEEAARLGVERADNFLFFISRESVRSEICLRELQYAQKLNKRIIPLCIEPVLSNDLPKEIQGRSVIDFTDNVSRADTEQDLDDLLKEIRQDAAYHNQHKVFLTQALRWQRQNYNPSILLRGYNLQNALTWLRLGKQRKDCPPTKLHEEFIETSAAKAGKLGSEVFISYSRKDGDFARKLNEDLQAHGLTTWFDQESIASGADFEAEIFNGIAASDNFLFILSPDSLNSDFCEREVKHAASFNKRVVTVRTRDVEGVEQPEALRQVQWIDFLESDFHSAFSELIRTLDMDSEHVHRHTKLTQVALEWEEQAENEDVLLRGSELVIAEAWLKKAEKEEKKPAPTALQTRFIQAAQEKREEEQRQSKRRFYTFRGLFVASFALLIVAAIAFVQAKRTQFKLQKEKEAATQVKQQLDTLRVTAEEIIALYQQPEATRDYPRLLQLLEVFALGSETVRLRPQQAPNGLWGYVTLDGEWVLPPRYAAAGAFRTGRAYVKMGEREAVIDTIGNFVHLNGYEKVLPFSEFLARAMQRGKWGFLDTLGQLKIPLQFEDVGPFIDGIARAQKGKKWGYINKKGDFIIPARYESAAGFSNGEAEVVYKGLIQTIDKSGECIRGCAEPALMLGSKAQPRAPTSPPFFEVIHVKGIAAYQNRPLVLGDDLPLSANIRLAEGAQIRLLGEGGESLILSKSGLYALEALLANEKLRQIEQSIRSEEQTPQPAEQQVVIADENAGAEEANAAAFFKVLAVRGKAAMDGRQVKPGWLVYPGHQIEVEEEGYVGLSFPDGRTLNLEEPGTYRYAQLKAMLRDPEKEDRNLIEDVMQKSNRRVKGWMKKIGGG